jgi:tRNA (guanine10-N2)-dimethyltransferase
VLEAESYPYHVIQKLPSILRLEADPKCVESIVSRCSLTRAVCTELLSTSLEEEAILKATGNLDFSEILKPGDTFQVRITRKRVKKGALDTLRLEREIGEAILSRAERAHVDLRQPKTTFLGAATRDRFFLGIQRAEIHAKPYIARSPRKRRFFHPSMMQPKYARCMVNLSRVKRGELLLDPFCGGGGILTEAALIGCVTAGSDIDRRMVRGCAENMKQLRLEESHLAVADARRLPFKRADAVATDPPYGRLSSTKGEETKALVESSLESLSPILSKGRYLCIALPSDIDIQEAAERNSFKTLERHLVYVHRSLTRAITVLQRV